jgi:hypothetical protein
MTPVGPIQDSTAKPWTLTAKPFIINTPIEGPTKTDKTLLQPCLHTTFTANTVALSSASGILVRSLFSRIHFR